MSISISNKAQTQVLIPVALREAGQRPAGKVEIVETAKTDKVTLGIQMETPADLSSILKESNRKVQEIIDLIMPLLEKQGLNLAKVVSGEQKLIADPAAIEKAKAAIADNGEFGVRQVAERILNFAKGAIGNDPGKLATIRAAVEDGFNQAAEILGGTLPEISQKTHDAIMTTFDRWESEGMSPDTTSSLKATPVMTG
jgi:hypothetical protein